jgi:chromosome partitioning protein
MSTIIAFVSQKGGVGKSTLSRALAVAAARPERPKRGAAESALNVKIADLDIQQSTSVEWNKSRIQAGLEPVISVEALGTAAQALKIAAQYDLLIIDAPARTSAGTLELAKVADLVVQPSGPSLDDLRPTVKEFHALVKQGIPTRKLAVALNHIGTDKEEQEARAYVEEAGYTVLAGYLPERPAYRKAQNRGRSITETTAGKLAEKADALIQALIDRIGEEDDAKPAKTKRPQKAKHAGVAALR